LRYDVLPDMPAMHELSIALRVLDLAAAAAASMDPARVVAIHLRVGPLSGVDAEALRSAYELARGSSPLKDARLEIELAPLRVFCESCASDQDAESVQALRCRRCGTPATRLVSGDELELRALEVSA